jgi:hypothetical protein
VRGLRLSATTARKLKKLIAELGPWSRQMVNKAPTIAKIAKVVPRTIGTVTTRFEVTLSCGCRFWEDKPPGRPPAVGEPVNCYERHLLPTAMTRPVD